MTVPQLAEKLEVSTRTVRRDLDALSAASIPIYTTRGRNGGVRLLPDFVLSKTLLSAREQDEILAALQSLRATGSGVESEVLTHLNSLFRRSAADWIDVDFSPWGGGPAAKAIFPQLKDAILERRRVTFDYFASNGVSGRRTVEPCRLCFKGANWYLQSYCLSRGAFRVFRLSRMSEQHSRRMPMKKAAAAKAAAANKIFCCFTPPFTAYKGPRTHGCNPHV